MRKSSKLQKRNLNDAFIALSDDDENMPSDISSSSGTSSFREKAKTEKTKKKLDHSSVEYSAYSTDYLVRNFNLLSPYDSSPKDNQSLSQQQSNLKRSGSLCAYGNSQRDSKNACFNKTRRSLELNISPLIDISNAKTSKWSGTAKSNKLENASRRLTPKTLKAGQKSKKEHLVEHNSSNSCPRRQKEESNTTPGRNTDIQVADNFTRRSLQTCRNLVMWGRVKHNQTSNFKNTKSRFADGSDENINSTFVSPTSNAGTCLPCCSYASVTPEVVKDVTEHSEIQEIRQLNNLSASGQTQNFTDTYFNQLENVLSKVGNAQDYLNPYSKTKQFYYERKKVDLAVIEDEYKNEILSNKMKPAFERKISNTVKSNYIEDNSETLKQLNLDFLKTQNTVGNEFVPQTKCLSELSETDGYRYRDYSEVETPATTECNKVKCPEIPIAAEFYKVKTPDISIATEFNKVKTPETPAATKCNKVKTPETVATTKCNKVKTPETLAAAEFYKVKTPDISIATDFNEVKTPETPAATKCNKVKTPETLAAAELCVVKTPETPTAAQRNKVKTPETPITYLVNKNLSEFCLSNIEDQTCLSPKQRYKQ